MQASSASSSSGSCQVLLEYSLSGRPTGLQELSGGLWALATGMAELLLLDVVAGQTVGLLQSRVPLTVATSLCWMSAEGGLAPPLLVAAVLLLARQFLAATRVPDFCYLDNLELRTWIAFVVGMGGSVLARHRSSRCQQTAQACWHQSGSHKWCNLREAALWVLFALEASRCATAPPAVQCTLSGLLL